MDRRAFCSILFAAFSNLLLFGCTRQKPKITYNDDIPIITAPRYGGPKAVVVYDSWSGNTRIIGEQFSRVLACHALQVNEVVDLNWQDYDLVLVGSPVHGGMPTGAITDFLSSLHSTAAVAVFVTYGAPLFGPFTANACLDRMAEKLETLCGHVRDLCHRRQWRLHPKHPKRDD